MYLQVNKIMVGWKLSVHRSSSQFYSHTYIIPVFLLRHFSHLSHNSITIHNNSTHLPTFSYIITKILLNFFFTFQKILLYDQRTNPASY